MAYGATDDFGFRAVEDKVHVHDLHATILHLLGLDHERLTYRHAGRDFRLTDVRGRGGALRIVNSRPVYGAVAERPAVDASPRALNRKRRGILACNRAIVLVRSWTNHPLHRHQEPASCRAK